jgi:Tfp pilus assembly protein PilV
MNIKCKERGVTLIETMLATLVATIAVFAICSTVFVATVNTKNQGTETTRAAIYAQDKIEKLLSLGSVVVSGTTASFGNCTQSSATQQASFPDCNVTGITGVGWATGLLAGGSTAPLASCSAPNVGYMDFLDQNGNQLAGASCSAALTSKTIGYIRQWQTQDANTFGTTPALKQITVAVYSLLAVNTNNTRPIVILTSYVSDPN